MMEKIIAVIVTYNRLEKLKKCIDCLMKQSVSLDNLVIVNNASSDGTTQYLQVVNNQKIIHIKLDENTGGSGGFERGIKEAVSLGADWIWGMDDDAFPRIDALEKLIEVKMIYEKEKICMWSNCNNDTSFEGDYKYVDKLMFVGFFISKKMIEKIGVPRGDFFIYYDDIEYSERIRESNYSIIKVKNSIIDHNDSASNTLIKFKIRGHELQIVSCPKQDWRVYYWVRNDILRYTRGSCKWIYKVIVHTPIKLIKLLLNNPQNIIMFFRGFIDGVCYKTGKIEVP